MNIAIFASGGGSNAEVIIKTVGAAPNQAVIDVAVVITNKINAGVIDIAKAHKIPTEVIKSEDSFEHGSSYLQILDKYEIDFIVLAGYLKKIPIAVIKKYHNKIVNIHPALLPAYGGKGMYGKHVHEAVINAGELQSGITIHYVDEVYDHGKIIFQAFCTVTEGETADTLAKKVLQLEHAHYTKEISKILLSQFPVK